MGWQELLILLVIVLIIFGAGKLPGLGDALGRTVKNFKRASTGQDEIDVTPPAPRLEPGQEGGGVKVERVGEAREVPPKSG